MARQNEKRDLLASVPLFRDLSKRQLGVVTRAVDEVEVPEGRVLAREGEIGREMFVVVRGGMRVTRKGRKVGELGPGEVFGEMSLIDHAPRSATVTANQPSQVLVLAGRAFKPLLAENPRMAEALLATLSRRLREATKTLYG